MLIKHLVHNLRAAQEYGSALGWGQYRNAVERARIVDSTIQSLGTQGQYEKSMERTQHCHCNRLCLECSG